jgi:hypothetical protein
MVPMARGSTLRRTLTMLAGVVTAGFVMSGFVTAGFVMAPVAAQAAAPTAETPFAADSGESCPLGDTAGVFGWDLFPPGLFSIVDVKGRLIDRPAKGETDCGSDVRYSVATFTAYVDKTVVDTQEAQIDDGVLDIGFQLTSRGRAINLVVVQVCRISLLPGPFDYCGKAQEFPLVP